MEAVGSHGDLLLLVVKDQPLAHIVAVNRRDRFHVKSLLTKPLRCVAVTKDGAVIFGCSESRIFCWMVGKF